MTDPIPPPFRRLRAEYGQGDDPADEVSLAAALGGRGDPWRLLDYLAGLGVRVRALDELLAGVNQLPDEEELAAFACAEGVAVSMASDGRWLLVTP